jgi:hypothetical protein
VTCQHVFTGNGFDPNRLFITREKDAKKGSKAAPIKGVAYASFRRDAAGGTDLLDVCVIEFADDMPSAFFMGAYVVDDKTVATGQSGHKLVVAGVLKEKTLIVSPDITIEAIAYWSFAMLAILPLIPSCARPPPNSGIQNLEVSPAQAARLSSTKLQLRFAEWSSGAG